MSFNKDDICDDPSIVCRVCFQYVSAENPAIPVNGDDTCLKCLHDAARLLENHVKRTKKADAAVRSLVAPAE